MARRTMSLNDVLKEARRNVAACKAARRDAERARDNADNNIELARALIQIEITRELEKRWRAVIRAIDD